MAPAAQHIPSKSFDYDLSFIQAGSDSLEPYLLSEEVFWPISAQPPTGAAPYPRLTLGALLLSMERLSAYSRTPAQETQLRKAAFGLDHLRSRWRAAWEKKARQSFSVRLRMWRDFIEEYRASPTDNADRYAYEVRLRAMLDLLRKEGGEPPGAELGLLISLDEYLSAVLSPGGFIWDSEVQSGFPKGEYWYLYVRLPSSPLR